MPKDMAVAKARGDRGCPRDDQIGKVFAVLPQGLLRCLLCEEIFSRSTAAEHAEVDCYQGLELWLLESSQGGNDAT
jgi:hypothetical protein